MRGYRRPVLAGIILAVMVTWGGSVAGLNPEHRSAPGSRTGSLVTDPAIGRGPTADSSRLTSPSPKPYGPTLRTPRRWVGPPPSLEAVDPPGDTPSPRADASIRPGRIGEDGPFLRGLATWYRWRPGEAAAGPGLRRFLGKSWRGMEVTVRRGDRSVRVRLTDWCACPGGRIVDLDVRAFAVLGDPSLGVLRVRVQR
jgi:hypothetical protein